MRKPGLLWWLMAAWLCAGCASDPDAPSPTAGSGTGGGAGGPVASGGTGAAGGAGGAAAGSGGGAAGVGGSAAAGAGAGGGGRGEAGRAGASGVSGSAASAGSAGGAGSAGAAADPCAGALFCEGFEDYAGGGPPGGDWQAQTNHGAVSIAGDRAFSGERAARFTTEANAGAKTAFIRLASAAVFPVQGNAYFGRMMFWLEAAPMESVHWTFIQSTGSVPGQSYRAQYRYGGQHPVDANGSFAGNQLMANYETPDSYSGNGPGSDCWHHAQGEVVPVGRWACAEWQFAGGSDTMRFWLDGEPIESLTVSGRGQGCVHQPATYAWTAPEFTSLEIGWESFQNDSARTLYIDDVVLSTEKIGCPAAP